MKQRIILFFSFLLFAVYLFGQERMVCDETCEVGDGQTSAVQKGEAGYAVVSPVGRGMVKIETKGEDIFFVSLQINFIYFVI